MIAAAVANRQALASRFLQNLGIPLVGMPAGPAATPAGPGPAFGTTTASGNIGVDEETMSWVLLLQLDPLLDARWIMAAQQRLWDDAAAVAVAALPDDGSGSDGDIAESGDETAMTVVPTAMTLSPERDRAALWHFPGARPGGGGGRRTAAQQRDDEQ